MRPLFRPLLYCLLVFALYFAGLARIGLVGPDEPRYAEVARGMMRSGDYVTPRLFGEPWFEKPPLYYWLAAISFRLDVNELTARLPSALAAALFLPFWFWFARRFYGVRAARFGCLLLATTTGWIGFGRAAAMDMLLATTLSAALALLMLWQWEDRRGGLYGFYALLAAATLAKGPLAAALAGMVILGYVIHRREWNMVRRMLTPPPLALYAAIALPWYLLCYWQNGYLFVQEFFIRHNLQRLTSAEAIGHPQPFWFYLPILPAGLFPWSATLLLPALDCVKIGWQRTFTNPRNVLLIYWVALPFAFFSASENKLPGYLLPILPPLTLWIGRLLGDACESGAPNRWLVAAALGISLALPLAAPLIALLLPEALASGLRRALAEVSFSGVMRELSSGPVPLAAWVVLVGLVVLGLVLLWRGMLLGAAFAGMFAVAWTVLLLTTYLSPAINRVASVRGVAQEIVARDIAPRELAVLYLHRNQRFGLGFYLNRLPPEWNPEASDSEIRFVAARSDIEVDRLRPGASSLSLFPAQRLRLWALRRPSLEPAVSADAPPN